MAGQICQRIRPKAPYGPQQLREDAEKQHCSAQRAQNHEAPQLPVRPPQEKEEQSGSGQKAVQTVQQPGQAGKAEAKGPQQVIQQPGTQAQEDGLAEHQQLVGDLISHDYPNRRLKKPPRPAPSSS